MAHFTDFTVAIPSPNDLLVGYFSNGTTEFASTVSNLGTVILANTPFAAEYTLVQAYSGNWQNTFTTVYGNSGTWSTGGTTYTTVNANSGAWGSGGSANALVNANSANWQSTYTTVTGISSVWTTVNTNSGSWGSLGLSALSPSFFTATGPNVNTISLASLLPNVPTNTNNYIVTINGVVQSPATDFYINGSNLVLTSNLQANQTANVIAFNTVGTYGGPNLSPTLLTASGSGTTSVSLTGLGNIPTNPNNYIVSINGVLQTPSVDFTIGSSKLNFTTALSAGENASIIAFNTTGTLGITPGSIYPINLSPGGPTWTNSGNVVVAGNLSASSIIGNGSWMMSTYSGVSGDGVIIDYLSGYAPGVTGLGRISVGNGTGSDSLAFYSNGPGLSVPTTTMYLSSNGMVGVNTSTPNTTLTVQGSISASGSIAGTNTFNSGNTLSSNLTGSRTPATPYTNNTGRILVVYIYGSNFPSNGVANIFINNIPVMLLNGYATNWGGSFIVPAGALYQVNVSGVTLQGWFEF